MTKIVSHWNRYDEYDQDFWLVGDVIETEWEDDDGRPANGPADEADATSCGTTLAALRAELTEEGEG